jgi:hypothetical protein
VVRNMDESFHHDLLGFIIIMVWEWGINVNGLCKEGLKVGFASGQDDHRRHQRKRDVGARCTAIRGDPFAQGRDQPKVPVVHCGQLLRRLAEDLSVRTPDRQNGQDFYGVLAPDLRISTVEHSSGLIAERRRGAYYGKDP